MPSSPKTAVIPATWEVPQTFRDRIGAKAGRQRLMESDGHLLLITHLPPEPDSDQRIPRFFWRHADGSWSSNDMGSGPGALGKHIAAFEQVVDQCEELEENAAGPEQYFQLLEKLAPVHRAASHLQSVLQEALQRASDDRELINLRDRAYELERTAELLYNGAKTSLDYEVARRAAEQAKSAHAMASSAHRLNVLAAFFFPIATLSSIFGMTMLDNWKSGWPPTMFTIVMLVGLAMGFGLLQWVTRRK